MPPPFTSNLLLFLPSMRELAAGDFDLDELTKILTGAIVDGSQRNEILQLRGNNAVLVIECLDEVASSDTFRSSSDPKIRSMLFSTTSKLSRRIRYLPLSCRIDPRTITLPSGPYKYGIRAEVYRGAQQDRSAAVKVLRTSSQEDPAKLYEHFCKEVIMWKYTSCPHILKLGGAFYHNGVPAIVTPWMPHGNVVDYLEKHPDTDRVRLLLGAVRGVQYLHDRNVAHGDIKVTSILVSDSTPPQALLTDFCFAHIAAVSAVMADEDQGSPSFMAPELLLPTNFGLEKAVPSKEADVYALGMTIYQVLTGRRPFLPRRKARIVRAVISGERPAKPENAEMGMADVVWDLLVECWGEDRRTRPTVTQVLKRFFGVTGEGEAGYSTLEKFADPRLNAGDRSSVVSEHSVLTDWTAPVTMSRGLDDTFDQEKIPRRKRRTLRKGKGATTLKAAWGRFKEALLFGRERYWDDGHSETSSNLSFATMDSDRGSIGQGEEDILTSHIPWDYVHSVTSLDSGNASIISFATVDSDPGPMRLRSQSSAFGLHGFSTSSPWMPYYELTRRSSNSLPYEQQLLDDLHLRSCVDISPLFSDHGSPPPMQNLPISLPQRSNQSQPMTGWSDGGGLSDQRQRLSSLVPSPSSPPFTHGGHRSPSLSPYPPSPGLPKSDVNPMFKVPSPSRKDISTGMPQMSPTPFAQLEAVASDAYRPLSPMSFVSDDASVYTRDAWRQ